MGFNDLINRGTQTIFRTLSNVDVAVEFEGVPVLTVRGIFDKTGLVEMGVITDAPQLTLLDSDLALIDTKAHRVVISGVRYRIVKPLPDGSGLTICGLIVV